MIRIPRHIWEEIFVDNSERYICTKCGKKVTILYFIYQNIAHDDKESICPETYIQEQLKGIKQDE